MFFKIKLLVFGALLMSISVSGFSEDKKSEKEIFPILKEYNWIAKSHAIYRNFNNRDKPPVPLIAYGYETKENYVFIAKQDKVGDLDALHSKALANLCSQKINWDQFGSYALTASGSSYSSELILCKDFLLEASKRLGTEKIYVAVPRRTVIYVASGNMSPHENEEFFKIVSYTFNDDSYGNAPITNLVFEYTNGEISGAMLVKAK